MQIVTRKAAQAGGLKRYFTGVPCKRAHVAERFTGDKTCVACDQARKVGNPAVQARMRAKYLQHREERLADQKRRNQRNAEAIKAQRRTHREANKDRINAAIAAWAKANPAKRRNKERNREARERGAEGRYYLADVDAIFARQEGLCANPYCGAILGAGHHIDHVLPIVLGGSSWPHNIQLLCQPCNQAKGAMHPDQWQWAERQRAARTQTLDQI
jgi:5-methylcytosine-specific restriction endonuclease McrA